MLVSNLQIKRTLQIAPLVLISLVLIDIALYFVPNFLGGLRINGYVAIGIPLMALAFYLYVGYPLFSFDMKGELLKVKSHTGLAPFFGKRLRVPTANITGLNIDESGFRDKLVITYINAQGEEVDEKFSITMLSSRKKQQLARAVQDFRDGRSPRNLHLFI